MLSITVKIIILDYKYESNEISLQSDKIKFDEILNYMPDKKI